MGRVTQHPDGLGTYLVESDNPKAPPYLVDLLANDGEGQCTCADWDFRIGKYLRDEMPPEKRFCKHLVAAREVMLDHVISVMLKNATAGGVGGNAHTD